MALTILDMLPAAPVGLCQRTKVVHPTGCKGRLQTRDASPIRRRFIYERPLQRGSTAMVTKAYDNVLHTTVAIKRLDRDAYIENGAKEFFIAQALGSHPHVVTVYDRVLCPANHELSLIMEYCDRGDLVDLLSNSEQEYDRGSFLRMARELASGVAHVHGKGIAHRDIKPDNVAVTGEGNTLKLMDFGTSVFINADLESLARGTTVPYQAPELVHSIKIDSGTSISASDYKLDLLKCDVWSLGITFYSMLTAQLPFASANLDDSGFCNYLRYKVLGSKDIWRTLHGDLRMLIRHMCDPDVESRWTIQDVEKYLAAMR